MRAAPRLGMLSVVLALIGSPPAFSDENEAAAQFEAGRRAFDVGDYDTAVQEFLAAYNGKPVPAVLINIATSYERIYKPAQARAYYERFLADAPAQSELRDLAEKRLRILRQLPGSIVVDTNRAGASVAVTTPNQKLIGLTPARFDALPPGDYHVHVELAGHVPIDQDVHLEPGESHVASFSLTRQVQTLTIFSQPEVARVFIDDRYVGNTPFSQPLEVGLGKRLRLEHADYPPYERTVDIDAAHPVTLKVKLPKPAYSGRTELVLASMAYGGAVTAGVTIAIGGDKVFTGGGLAVLIPTTLAGIGLGFLGSYVLTDDAFKVGHSSLIVGSTIWGTSLFTSISLAAGLSTKDTFSLGLLGSSLGAGSGIIASWLADTSAGDAAIINSGGLWGTVAGALLAESVGFNRADHDRAFGFSTLGGTTLGLVTGALVAWRFEVDRTHVALVDMTGLIGGLLGYGLGYASGVDNPLDQSGTICGSGSTRCLDGARYALGGMTIGLLAAALLTQRFYKDELPAIPKMDAVLTRHDDRWAMTLPQVHFTVVPVPEGLDRRVTVDLLHGEF